jgi:hypothetical protein
MNHAYRVIPDTDADVHATRLKQIKKTRERAFEAFCLANDIEPGHDGMGTVSRFEGVGNVPFSKPGWKWSKRHGTNVPNRQTPEGKEIAKQLKAIPPGINWHAESDTIFKHGLVMSAEGNSIYLSYAKWGWSLRGTVVVMSADVKQAAKTWPKGLREITLSVANKIVNGA